MTDLHLKGSKHQVEEIICMKRLRPNTISSHFVIIYQRYNICLMRQSMQNQYDSNHEGQHKVIVREEIATHHGWPVIPVKNIDEICDRQHTWRKRQGNEGNKRTTDTDQTNKHTLWSDLPTNLCSLLSHKGAALRPFATNAKKAFFTCIDTIDVFTSSIQILNYCGHFLLYYGKWNHFC